MDKLVLCLLHLCTHTLLAGVVAAAKVDRTNLSRQDIDKEKHEKENKIRTKIKVERRDDDRKKV